MDARDAEGDPDLSAVAKLLAEPPRAKALMALADGRWLPASMLALEAGVSGSTMSGHLARLVDGGLLTVQQQGRYRYFRLADPWVAELVEVMARCAPRLRISSLRADTRARAVRRARHCYDHLGGRLAVAITAAMLRDRHLDAAGQDLVTDPGALPARVLGPSAVTLTASGSALLERLGAHVPAGTPARCCVDWTEHRHHLAGAPGRAVLDACREHGWISPGTHPRALRLSGQGRDRLESVFGIELTEMS
ncbi:ArsR/SmtB family transcription factor [Brachybacterium hainanense]|uniref:ArsR/SmtB family transcription factor n=1 Tax=Brachybacterium hainanense TaxID=1541174 RepID=A0ABV6RAP6_9MICO